jgi:hypothetical protein
MTLSPEGAAVGAVAVEVEAEGDPVTNGVMLTSSVERNRLINTLFNGRLLAQMSDVLYLASGAAGGGPNAR